MMMTKSMSENSNMCEKAGRRSSSPSVASTRASTPSPSADRQNSYNEAVETSIEFAGLEPGHWLWEYENICHHPEDLALLSVFLELAEMPGSHNTPTLAKLLLRIFKFLYLCDYDREQVCVFLAHASTYFREANCAHQMRPEEAAYVLGLYIFIAHSYVEDEVCPLKTWHKHIFRRYCELRVLNSAVIKLMGMRDYKLRVEDEVVACQTARLLHACLGQENSQAPVQSMESTYCAEQQVDPTCEIQPAVPFPAQTNIGEAAAKVQTWISSTRKTLASAMSL